MNTVLNMKGRSILSLDDMSDAELAGLLGLAQELKEKRKSGVRGNLLACKNIAMIFEKSSTRTRCATSIAVHEEGGNADYLSSHDIHLGKKESAADTARVLGRLFDGILYRGHKHKTIVNLAKNAGVPVWNGLTDEAHPTQIFADLMTIKEHFGQLKGLKFAYVGDGRNNVANSLMLGCAKTGMHFVNCTPKELTPSDVLVERASRIAEVNGSSITIRSDVNVVGANIIATDVWVSMGEEDKQDERMDLLMPYQVNMDVVQSTGNVDSNELIFLHCLPAFHDNNTELTRFVGAMEVTNDVFEASFSKVFDEAENRMHTIKAMLVATLC